MSATNRATSVHLGAPTEKIAEARRLSAAKAPSGAKENAPTLPGLPFLTGPHPRRFARVPTHTVGVFREQREYPRATLKLPLRLRSINGIAEPFPVSLVTRNISSTGVYFLCPRELVVGASIGLEIILVSKPMGRGNVVMGAVAHVLRIEPAAMPGWFGIAASFDDVQFDRDDGVPSRFVSL